MSLNNAKDRFVWGLLLSLLLPPVTLIILFNIKYSTNQPIWEAIWKFSKTGLLGNDMITSLFPCLVLFFIFYKIEWWKACRGLVLGTVAWFVVCILYLA